MLTIYPERWPGRMGRLALDVTALLWTAVWALSGYAIYRLVLSLQVLADAITSTGQTFDRWIQAFRNASPANIPGLSGALHSLADSLQRSAGAPLIARGMEAHARINELATLLGLFVALLPIVSVTGTYLFWRWRDARDVDAAAQFVQGARLTGQVAEASALLAHRAVAQLPLRQLMRVSGDPLGDLAAGRYDALAAAMLRQAGMRPLPVSSGQAVEQRR